MRNKYFNNRKIWISIFQHPYYCDGCCVMSDRRFPRLASRDDRIPRRCRDPTQQRFVDHISKYQDSVVRACGDLFSLVLCNEGERSNITADARVAVTWRTGRDGAARGRNTTQGELREPLRALCANTLHHVGSRCFLSDFHTVGRALRNLAAILEFNR